MKILIAGHTGMLGRCIIMQLLASGNKEICGISKSSKLNNDLIQEFQIDLCNELLVRDLISEIKPDIIINCAAYTNLQFCENNKQEAYNLHVRFNKLMSSCTSTRVIYISTDSVFDGASGNYREQDIAYPLNYYALSKYLGELALCSGNNNSLIIRTNLYGFKPQSQGTSLAEWALNSFKQGNPITGYNDVIFNPLYIGQLAEIIQKLMNMNITGILHAGSLGSISKFLFLKKLADLFGYNDDRLLNEANSPKETNLKRPKNTVLSLHNLSEILGEIPLLDNGLEMFKADYLSFENQLKL